MRGGRGGREEGLEGWERRGGRGNVEGEDKKIGNKRQEKEDVEESEK